MASDEEVYDSWTTVIPSDAQFEYDSDIAVVETRRPNTDLCRIWCWVYKIDSQPNSYEYLHQSDKSKTVLGVIEEGEQYGLHVGGLTVFTNNYRKTGAIATANRLCESLGFKGSVKYCEPPRESDGGSSWFVHNCKHSAEMISTLRAEARARGWNLYWTREDKRSKDDSAFLYLRQSGNMDVINKWFENYKTARGDDIPTYNELRLDAIKQFGGGTANVERNLRMLYDSWCPSKKRNWISAAMATLPDDSPLVKQMRREIDFEGCARMLSEWSKYWQVYSEQRDYQMKDVDHQDCMRLYAVMMMVICRTSSRVNDIKWHGLWLVGDPGVGKSMLARFVAGCRNRIKNVNMDAKGVGRFNMNQFQEVLIIDDVKTVKYDSMDLYSVVNQILDNGGASVKIFGSTVELQDRYIILTSNDRIQKLEDDQPAEEKTTHPLRRRVLEIRMSKFVPQQLSGQIWSIYERQDKRDDGDRLMWMWYRLESDRHKFGNGCRDRRLMDLQKIMDYQCEQYLA